MKRFFLFLFLSFVMMFSYAQDNSTHLKFMGIPIDGSLAHVTQALIDKGFVLVNRDESATYLKGDFAGYSDCGVLVNSKVIKGKRTVSSISVFLPDRYSWASLYTDYTDVKEGLTKKYGTPIVHEPYDSYEYVSYYTVGNDFIAVKIGKDNVGIHYLDKLGEEDEAEDSDPMLRDL